MQMDTARVRKKKLTLACQRLIICDSRAYLQGLPLPVEGVLERRQAMSERQVVGRERGRGGGVNLAPQLFANRLQLLESLLHRILVAQAVLTRKPKAARSRESRQTSIQQPRGKTLFYL